MSLHPQHFYRFDGFTIDTEQRVLLRSGSRVQLTPKALDILLALIQRSGEVGDKETLMKEVWPDTFVEDINLAYNIHVLRKVLGAKNGSRDEYIETIPKRGYRFIQSVSETNGHSNDGPDLTEVIPARAVNGRDRVSRGLSSYQKRLGLVTLLMLVVVTMVLIVFGYSNRLKRIETGHAVESAFVSLPAETAEVESRAKKILELLIDERFADLTATFDRNLSRNLTPRQVRQVWHETKRLAGVFKKILDVTSTRDQGLDVVDLRCQFEAARFVLRVMFNAKAEISGIWLLPANSTPPEPSSPGTADGADELKRLTQEVVDKLVSQDFEGITTGFSSSLRSKISAQQIQREWRSIVAQAGPFKRVADILRDYDLVNARLQFKRGFVNMRVEFDAQKNISALFVQLSN